MKNVIRRVETAKSNSNYNSIAMMDKKNNADEINSR